MHPRDRTNRIYGPGNKTHRPLARRWHNRWLESETSLGFTPGCKLSGSLRTTTGGAWGSPFPIDPTRPATTIKTAWESLLRKKAGVSSRLHDLRHTVATKMAAHEPGGVGALLAHSNRSEPGRR